MKPKILVHDDETILRERYVERLQELGPVKKNFEVKPLGPEEFTVEMEKLSERQRILRRGKKGYDRESVFDEAAILVVDFDLLKSVKPLNSEGQQYGPGSWNSETVAYLVRCFSNCRLILGMNLPTCYEFDLTLRGHLDSYADLNIVRKQLGNPGLWADEFEGFRQWYWPNLNDFLVSLESRTDDVRQHLDEPICSVLGLDEVIEILPKSVTGFLAKKDPESVTFRQFVERSSHGLYRKDHNPNLETICRIAAARIAKWLECR